VVRLIILGIGNCTDSQENDPAFFVCDLALNSAADQFPNIINTTALYILDGRIAWQSVPDAEKNQMIQRIDAVIVVCKKIMGLKRGGAGPTC
jgi:hypothetical protein